MQNCERCGQSSLTLRMSFFNTDMLCSVCEETEKAHPGYQAAKDVEIEAVRKGNYNFPGVGLPDDLVPKPAVAPLEEKELTGGENQNAD